MDVVKNTNIESAGASQVPRFSLSSPRVGGESMRVGEISIGRGEPLVLISGLNVIESLDATLECAEAVQGVADRHGLPVVFKASFDKANRSSQRSYRGPGLDEGLRILARVKRDTGLPVVTDVHE